VVWKIGPIGQTFVPNKILICQNLAPGAPTAVTSPHGRRTFSQHEFGKTQLKFGMSHNLKV
jgi:hypothetical protein